MSIGDVGRASLRSSWLSSTFSGDTRAELKRSKDPGRSMGVEGDEAWLNGRTLVIPTDVLLYYNEKEYFIFELNQTTKKENPYKYSLYYDF